jgi:hypothetical protein
MLHWGMDDISIDIIRKRLEEILAGQVWVERGFRELAQSLISMKEDVSRVQHNLALVKDSTAILSVSNRDHANQLDKIAARLEQIEKKLDVT